MKLKESLSLPSLLLATVIAIGNFLALSFDASKPQYRWAIWIVAAFLAGIVCIQKPPLATLPIEPERDTKRRFRRYISGTLCVVMVIVLLLDFGICMWLSPFKHDWAKGVKSAVKPVAGITIDTPDNVLRKENILSVYALPSDDRTDPKLAFDGPYIEAKIQKRPGYASLELYDLQVAITRYEPLPQYKGEFKAGPSRLDSIDACFFLTPSPGVSFPPEYVRIDNGYAEQPSVALPRKLDDVSSTEICFYFGASDPGIYWIKLIVNDVIVTRNPIPLALYKASPQNSFIHAEYLDVLKGKNPSWIPWPPLSESQKQLKIKEREAEKAPAAPKESAQEVPASKSNQRP